MRAGDAEKRAEAPLDRRVAGPDGGRSGRSAGRAIGQYELGPIAELAHQLELSPRRLRLRQLQGIERLVELIQPGRRYPFGWVCFHVTGYRPAEAGGPAGAMDGKALMADLVRLAEQLSDSAGIMAEGLGEPVWSTQELARRLGVSAKTIARWRLRGLVGWRVRGADGRSRLVFRERVVRRFVWRQVELVRRAASFSQLGRAERERIIERARQLAGAGGGRSLHGVARQVSAETGRAVETVRYTLRRYEREHPERAIFGGSSEPRGAGDGELVYQLYRQGERVRELARRLGRSESAIYRMLAEVRARRVLSRRIEFVYSAEFERPDADAVILGGGGGENGIDGGAGGYADKAVPVRLQQLYRLGLLSRQRERELFRRYNYLKFKAARLQERIEPSRPRTRQLEQIERLLAEADEIKNRIIQANLRLVVSIARRHAGCAVGLNELISDGNVSLMRAVEKFDYTRGNKFSTYATLAIMKNYARTIPEENYRLGRFQTGRQEVLEVAPAAAEDAAWPDERRGLELGLQRVLSKLSARERLIVTRHYGLVEDGRRQTLEQIGKLLGLTKERVRQIEKRALARLRDLLSLPMSGGLNLSG